MQADHASMDLSGHLTIASRTNISNHVRSAAVLLHANLVDHVPYQFFTLSVLTKARLHCPAQMKGNKEQMEVQVNTREHRILLQYADAASDGWLMQQGRPENACIPKSSSCEAYRNTNSTKYTKQCSRVAIRSPSTSRHWIQAALTSSGSSSIPRWLMQGDDNDPRCVVLHDQLQPLEGLHGVLAALADS
jgi:hypothetical protein